MSKSEMETGPTPPTEEQERLSDQRSANLLTLFQVGCSVCSYGKLGRGRTMVAHQDEMTCILIAQAYPSQVSDRDKAVALACKMPELYKRIWDHETGDVSEDDVVKLRPFDASGAIVEVEPVVEEVPSKAVEEPVKLVEKLGLDQVTGLSEVFEGPVGDEAWTTKDNRGTDSLTEVVNEKPSKKKS